MFIRPASSFLVASALLAGAVCVAGEPDPSRLTWIAADGTVAWSAPLAGPPEGTAARPSDLRVMPWNPMLPRLELRDLEDHPWNLALTGKAVLLSFWATWCEPCRVELPHLQELYDAERERGLQVLAVNVDEPPEIVRHFLAEVGLHLPVALASAAVNQALAIKSLPQVVLADAHGAIRARWDGYKSDLVSEITDRVNEVLVEPASPGEVVAQVVRGADRIDVRWSREAPAPIDALVMTPGPEDHLELLVLAGRDVARLDAGGGSTRLAPAWGAGRLRCGDVDGDGRAEFLSFRPGSTRVVRLDLAGNPHRHLEVRDPIFDLEILPAVDAASRGEVLLEPQGRLRRVTEDGVALGDDVPIGAVTDLAVVGRGAAARVALLDAEGRLNWLDRKLQPIEPRGSSWPGQRLIVPSGSAAAGLALAPPGWSGVALTTMGQAGSRLWVTGPGQLVAFDAASGNEVVRVLWPGAGALAAGDLDGDGSDELAVASGLRVTVLHLK